MLSSLCLDLDHVTKNVQAHRNIIDRDAIDEGGAGDSVCVHSWSLAALHHHISWQHPVRLLFVVHVPRLVVVAGRQSCWNVEDERTR